MKKQPQLFIRVGANQYITVDTPQENCDLYMWDDTLKQIVLKTTAQPK